MIAILIANHGCELTLATTSQLGMFLSVAETDHYAF